VAGAEIAAICSLSALRDMLWAEACHVEEQAARFEIDPWEDSIVIWTPQDGRGAADVFLRERRVA
jgi:hypothetical protein